MLWECDSHRKVVGLWQGEPSGNPLPCGARSWGRVSQAGPAQPFQHSLWDLQSVLHQMTQLRGVLVWALCSRDFPI